MGTFLQAAAAVLIGMILTQLLSERDKSYAVLMSIGICALVLTVGLSYLGPVVDFIRRLEDLGNLHTEMVGLLLKAAGLGIVTELAALLCQDSGNGSMAQSLRILSSLAMLWLSLPVFEALMDLIQKILEGI